MFIGIKTQHQRMTAYFDRGFPLLIWGISSVFVLFQFLIQLTSGVIVQELMSDFALSGLGAGLLASSYYYMYFSLQVPAGLLMDKFGPRHLLSWGALVCGGGCITFALASNLGFAFFGRFLMGTGASFAFVGSLYLIREWYPTNRYAFLIGITEAFGMIGTIIGTISFAAALEKYGWRSAMIVAGIIAIIIGLACWILIRDYNPKNIIKPTKKPQTTFLQRFFFVISNPLAWANGLYNGLVFTILSVFAALWCTPFFQANLNISLTKAAQIGTMLYLGTSLGCPLMGGLSEKLKQRRPLLLVSSLSSSLIISLVIYWPNPNFYLESFLMFLLGISGSGYMLTFAISDDIAPRKIKSTYLGFTNAIGVITAPIFQPIVGYLLDLQAKQAGIYTAHEYKMAFIIFPILLLSSALIAWKMPETYHRKNILKKKKKQNHNFAF